MHDLERFVDTKDFAESVPDQLTFLTGSCAPYFDSYSRNNIIACTLFPPLFCIDLKHCIGVFPLSVLIVTLSGYDSNNSLIIPTDAFWRHAK